MPQDFKKFRDFVLSFVKKLDIAPHATRVGLGVFADDFFGQFDLGQHRNHSSLVKAIRQVPYQGGGTNTGKGLRGMRTTGFCDGVVRKNAAKIGVVLTDGRSKHRTNTILEAAHLKDKGVWLFAIGVGSRVDTEELSTFASEPKTEFLRHVDTFDALSRLTNDLALSVCRLLPPHADNATCGINQKADVIFVYNAATMSAASVSSVQMFTERVVEAFSMTSGNVRVGVMSKGRQGGDIALSEYIRQDDFVRALQHQPRSLLATLLKKVREKGYEPSHGGRPNSKKIVVIFVDDVNVSIDALVEARMLTYSDVTVHVVGVGLHGDKSKVQRLFTTASTLTTVAKLTEFQDYDELMKNETKQTDFITKLCEYI